MGRIPEEELERIKQANDLVALVRASGLDLKPHGVKDLVGRCPFHDGDETPSLVVTPDKRLWHCFGCGAGGDVIEWVRKTRGLSFLHAVEILRHGGPPPSFGGVPVKDSTVRVLPPPVELDAEDHTLMLQVVEYYHATLKTSPEALAYLKKRCIDSPDAVSRFKLGYANRTLGLRLPTKDRAEGRAIRVGSSASASTGRPDASTSVAAWSSAYSTSTVTWVRCTAARSCTIRRAACHRTSTYPAHTRACGTSTLSTRAPRSFCAKH